MDIWIGRDAVGDWRAWTGDSAGPSREGPIVYNGWRDVRAIEDLGDVVRFYSHELRAFVDAHGSRN